MLTLFGIVSHRTCYLTLSLRLAIFLHTRNGKVDVSALPSPTMRDAFGNAAQNEAVMDTRLQVEAESHAGVELVNCLVSLISIHSQGRSKD